jgi:predicted RNA polymerase sigma factor
MVDGPRAGLALLDELEAGGRLAGHHRVPAVRGNLLERAGDRRAAAVAYSQAAQRATSTPEQRFLAARAARLRAGARP